MAELDQKQWKWICAGRRELTTVTDSREAYLSVEVPSHSEHVKMVTMECESHDQGWSSYPDDQGTRNNSWTFGDLSVQDDSGADVHKEDRVYTNLHACSDWELHKVEYGEDHALTKSLGPGKIMVLSLNAQFPGWENFVKYAQLTVYFV